MTLYVAEASEPADISTNTDEYVLEVFSCLF